MKKFLFAISALGVLFQPSCTKEEEEEKKVVATVPVVTIEMSHEVSGEALVFNERKYHNAAGNPYEVRHLEYFITDFKLKDNDGEWIALEAEPLLMNPEIGNTQMFATDVPVGSYYGFSCMIGIPVEQNYTGSLPNTIENMNMAWPDPIGGGYHFMKLEGNYEDSSKTWKGYTVHLGKNGYQAVNMIENVQLEISQTSNTIGLTMDINQWYDEPNLYDFNVDGNYTMAIDTLMLKVGENGRNCISVNK